MHQGSLTLPASKGPAATTQNYGAGCLLVGLFFLAADSLSAPASLNISMWNGGLKLPASKSQQLPGRLAAQAVCLWPYLVAGTLSVSCFLAHISA